MKPLTSVLINPAGPDCSLACHYCYYLDKSALFPGTAHRMSEAVLRNTVRQMMQQGGQRINFAWQGGEPTLMGLRFYETAVHYQSRCSRPGQQAGNGLQTNGLHIDEHWARFLHQNSFLVIDREILLSDVPAFHKVLTHIYGIILPACPLEE